MMAKNKSIINFIFRAGD